jgi:hypothetical protein
MIGNGTKFLSFKSSSIFLDLQYIESFLQVAVKLHQFS